jgi:uncharacterized protein (DUF1697 family)
MPRYAALLRAVSPMNAKNADLKWSFERAGFTEVRTVISSGNVVFNSRAASLRSLERKAEAAMEKELGKAFLTIVRPQEELQVLLARDPYRAFRLPREAKRVVTFLRTPWTKKIALPIELHGAKILAVQGAEVFSFYLPSPQGPVFMSLIEKTFGRDVTTRTWGTVGKLAKS